MKIAIVTLILTQLMNLAFIGPLKHAGLSLSIGLAACLNASLLYWQLRKQKIFTPQPGWMAFLLRLVVAVLVMSGVLLGMLHIMPEWSLGTMCWRGLPRTSLHWQYWASKLKNLPAGRCNDTFRPAVQAGDNLQIEIFLLPRWVVEV